MPVTINSLAWIGLILSTVSSVHAESFVDLRSHQFNAIVTKVEAPNLIKVETTHNGIPEHFWIEPVYLQYGALHNKACIDDEVDDFFEELTDTKEPFEDVIDLACEQLESYVLDKEVKIEIVDWNVSPWKDRAVMRGYVTTGSTNITYEYVSKGIYSVDFAQTRDAILVHLEKQARCSHLGIWSSTANDPIEDLKCKH